ncbi:hypothetical protein [Actinophytocola sp. NPDC049390]|uniref:hypothetical protein n=1 Tax=Actinophytocola sp. NPDC049390 TaxID=3363894 RepID=UPI0037B8A444
MRSMFITQEVVSAEMSYRMEQARDAARRAQVQRLSFFSRLFTRAPRARSTVVTRGRPVSARI